MNALRFYQYPRFPTTHIQPEKGTKGKHAGITYKRGDMIQRFEYAAYGRESFVLNPNLAWDPAFTGQQYDIETGLYYYRARYYNPVLGRFIQPDTIVQDPLDPQSWNRYAYVRNNPLKYVDPSGHVIVIDLGDDGGGDESTATVISDSASVGDGSGSTNTGGDDLDPDGDGLSADGHIVINLRDSGTGSGAGSTSGDSGEGHRDGGVSVRDSGGLVGASTSQAGSAVASSSSSGMSLSGALNIARNVSEIVGWIGVGVSLVAPQIGGPILIGSMIAGIAIDAIDYTMGGISLSHALVNTGATIIGHFGGGAVAKAAGFGYGYSNVAKRYFSKGGSLLSKSRGGFVRTEVGIMGKFVEHFIGVDIDFGLKASWELLGGEK